MIGITKRKELAALCVRMGKGKYPNIKKLENVAEKIPIKKMPRIMNSLSEKTLENIVQVMIGITKRKELAALYFTSGCGELVWENIYDT